MTVVLMILIGALLLAFAVPRLFGLQLYVVTSGSMEPDYPVGSLIYVQPVSPEEVEVQQEITFVMPCTNSIATHQVRIIDEQNQQLYTQGINNRDEQGNILPDATPVPFDNLIGEPVCCIPMLGKINQFCTTPPGLYILLGIVALAIVVSWLLDKLVYPSKSSIKHRK